MKRSSTPFEFDLLPNCFLKNALENAKSVVWLAAVFAFLIFQTTPADAQSKRLADPANPTSALIHSDNSADAISPAKTPTQKGLVAEKMMVVGCDLTNYASATIVGPGDFPYASPSGITVNAAVVGVGSLDNTTYTCGGNSYSTSSPAWWIFDSGHSITLTFSAAVTNFSVVVNGSNVGEVFTFTPTSGSVSLDNYCSNNFTLAGGNQLQCISTTGGGATGTLITINNPTGSTQYTITHNGSAAGSRVSLLDCFTSDPLPTVDPVSNVVVCGGETVPQTVFTGSAGATFNWTNNNTGIGLGASGSGNIPSFPATNVSTQQVATITVTPQSGGVDGTPINFTITVNPEPTISLGTLTDPSTCNGSNGSIAFTSTNLPNGTYSLTYTGTGSPKNVTVNGNAFTLTGLSAGDYSNFSLTNNGCTGNAAGPVTLSNPSYTWYQDADNDNYSNGMTLTQCSQPVGYDLAGNLIATSGDCNDNNAAIHPGATEVCNGVDDNCVGGIDDGLTFQNYYLDSDSDTYGAGAPVNACQSPGANYVTVNGDCNNNNASIHPGATEVCNGIDDNCVGGTDEGVRNTYYADNDNDGYGNTNNFALACNPPPGYVSNNTDCDDNDPNEHPGQVWYIDADGDDYGASSVTQCLRPSNGFLLSELSGTGTNDCNDNAAAIHPGATEVCNGIDDDCDTSTDEGLTFQNYYLDSDSDNYGAGAAVNACQSPGANYVLVAGDCNNNNASIYPGATEVCNGVDDNCANGIDDGLTFQNYYLDSDSDSYGAGAAVNACQSPGANYVLVDGDCNNNNASIYPGATEVCNGVDDDCDMSIDDNITFQNYYLDGDSDNYGAGAPVNACQSPGANYVLVNGDCNDDNETVNPGATEVCNGVDDNCANGIDDGLTFQNYYLDSDSDSYGAGAAVNACQSPGANYVLVAGDCNNNNASIYPGATEVCNGVDDDCDMSIDDNITFQNYYLDSDSDNYGAGAAVNACQSPGANYVLVDGDCNDDNETVNPGATEVCNGVDDNCANGIDDGLTFQNYYLDSDSDNYGAGAPVNACQSPGANYVLVDGDCNNNNSSIYPGATEACNGVDDDCDMNIDDGITFQNYYLDSDSDSYGAGAAVNACQSPGANYVLVNGDCNNNNSSIYPGATEVCNDVDDDCDTDVDEGVLSTFYADNDNDTYGDPNNSLQACSAPDDYVSDNTDCDDTDADEHPGQVWYIDADGDDYGASSTTQCLRPANGFLLTQLSGTGTDDCNDGNDAINPAATELCNDVDDNCDTDVDEGFDMDDDGIGACNDNCPTMYNPSQADEDEDGVGDACDNCQFEQNADQADTDEDSIGNVCDNCLSTPNPEQEDDDEDGFGNACDACTLPNVFLPEDGAATVACIALATQPTTPTGIDQNGNSVTPSGPFVTNEPDPLACEGTRTYTWLFLDCEENSYYWSFTYTIEQEDFTVPANGEATVSCPADATQPTPPTVMSSCGETLTPTGPVTSSTPACEGMKTYTWTYTDCEGTSHNWVFTYTIERSNFEVPANGEAMVSCPALATQPTPPTVMSNCGEAITPTGPVVSTTPACEGMKTYTWTYTDCEGSSHDWVFTYTIERSDFTVPTNGASTVSCVAQATLPTAPTVVSNCGETLVPTGPAVLDNPEPVSCGGIRTYTWTYTDCEGTSHNWSFVYTISPVAFSVPSNGTAMVACLALATPPTPPTVNGACGGAATPTGPVIADAPNPLTCEGTRTYTWTYTDCAGNNVPWSFVYTIERSDFTVPANGSTTVSCPALATQPTPPTVMSNCGETITPTGPVVGTTPACEGMKTYTWTYTDCEGNSHDWTFTYTIERSDFTVPANGSTTVSCPALATQPTPPTVMSNCGETLTPTGPVVGTTPACEGTKTFTWTYTDCEGNSHDWVFTYTIERSDFTVPANGEATVACAALATQPTPPTVMSNCGETLTPTGPVVGTTPACEGTKTYTWTYTDCEGNTHDWTFTYTIERSDFEVPANGSATVSCPALATQPTPPTVTSNCGEAITPTGPIIGAIPACEGTKTYTWTYIDCEGTSHDWVFTYTIERSDFTVPTNAAATVSCVALATVPTPPTVMSNCGEAITPTGPAVVDEPMPLVCGGIRTYTWTYTDCEGTSHNWSFVYTVNPVVFTMPADGAATVACASLATLPTPPTVNDACGNATTPTGPIITDVPNPLTCEGTKTYTWTYTDCAGNNVPWSFVYTIERSDFTVPANGSATIACAALATQPTPPSVTSNCGETLTPTGPVIGATPACEGTKSFTWTYTDCEGNTHDWSFVYTIERNDFAVPANGSATVACAALATQPTPPTVTSNCGEAITPTGPVIGATPACEGTKTYTWTYTDCEGNTHPWVFTYTIERNDFTVPANGAATVSCPALATQPTPPTVTSNCGEAITPTGPVVSPTPACEGTKTYTWTYTDCEGNSHPWTFTYTIDQQAISIGVPTGTALVNCNDATDVAPTPPVVTSSCGVVLTPVLFNLTPKNDCEGHRVYTYRYTNCEGSFADWTFIYTVEYLDFNLPASETVTVECPLNAEEPTPPTVDDSCGGTIIPTGPEVTSTSNAGDCEASRTYAWTYEDCEGNLHVWSKTYFFEYTGDFFTFTDQEFHVGCLLYAQAPVPPTMYDNCDQEITISGPTIVEDIDDSGCSGVRSYTFVYTDCGGHSHPWTFTYYASDNEPPVGSCPSGSANSVDVTDLTCAQDVPCPGDYDFSSKIQEMIQAGNFYDVCSGDNLIVTLDSWTALWECSDADNDGKYTFGRTFYFSIADQCGNELPDLCSVTYSGRCQPITTYSQDIWGLKVTNTDNEGIDLIVIQNLLDNFGPLTIGGGNRSLKLTQASCVGDLLPAWGGTPAALFNCHQTNCSGCNPISVIGIKNPLAANTIALELSLRYSAAYNGANMDSVTEQGLGCIALNPNIVHCSAVNNCVLRIFDATGNVYEYPYTIGGLLDLSNYFLGGNLNLTFSQTGVYSTAINQALEAVIANWYGGSTPVVCNPAADATSVDVTNKSPYPVASGGSDAAISFSISPNPANREVNFQLDGLAEAEAVTMDIYNQFGQLLLHKEFGKVASVSERLDISSFGAGLHFVSIKAGGQRFEQKLVVGQE